MVAWFYWRSENFCWRELAFGDVDTDSVDEFFSLLSK
jgi:hypothetical protein